MHDDEAYLDALLKETFRAAPDHWTRDALEAIHLLRANQATFTADDLHDLVGTPEHSSPNVIGAVFREAKRHGYIKPTGVFVKSHRRTTHGRILMEWTTT